MFNVGLPEIVIIILVVVVFVNPKELPGFFRKIGKFVQQMKEMRETFIRSVEEIKNQVSMAETTTASTDKEPRQDQEADDQTERQGYPG